MLLHEENLFTKIAKILAIGKIKRDISKVEELIGDEPSLSQTMESIKFHLDYLEKNLPDFCKKNPNSPACKDYNKKGK